MGFFRFATIILVMKYLRDCAWPCNCVYLIGGVMVSLLSLSAVDRVFEPRSGQTKDYKIGICCFSAKNAAIRRKANIIGAICLSADYSFSKLALCKIQISVLVLYEADLIINSLNISLFSA